MSGSGRPATRRRRWSVAGILGAAGLSFSLALVAVAFATARPAGPTPPGSLAAQAFGILSASTVGAILIGRLPQNRLGAILLGAGLVGALGLAAVNLADFGLVAHPGSIPGAIWLAWFQNWSWAMYVIPIAWFVPMLFPSGHLPSPRWRILAVIAVACIVAASVSTALQPLTGGQFPAWVQSPLVLTGPGADLISTAGIGVTVVGLATFPLVAVSLIQRFRRSSGIEHQQYKWFASAVAFTAPPLVVGLLLSNESSGPLGTISNVAWALVILGLGLLPVAIGIAMLKYHLYEIDRLVSRTVAYGLLTLILAVTFPVVILLLQAALAPFDGSNELAVAGSTLVIAGAFQPIRRRVTAVIDRRFNRAHYDAERTVTAFADRLRDEVDLDVLRADVVRTVDTALAPAALELWLR